MNEVIIADDLRKQFTARGVRIDAVRGVSLTVERGEIFGLLGVNGAGKTTTMRMLTTLLPIDAGTAMVGGIDVSRHPRRVRSRVGYVSQLGGADDMATGRENLTLQAGLYGCARAGIAARVDEVLALLDLEPLADRQVRSYSGGQRRRLDIALGIVHRPELLFLDEPTNGLDPQNRTNLWEHVRLLRDHGTTVFLTTHYLDEADALCDQVVILDHGKIAAEGSPWALKHEVVGDAVLLRLEDAVTAERALLLLGTIPFVTELSAVDGDQVRLYVQDGSASLPTLLRLLDFAHLGLTSISLSQPTLDDVFLSTTGHSLRDTGADASGTTR